MAKLSSKKRKKLPKTAFAYPGTRKYPIHDRSHARNALARAAQKKTSGSYAHVAAAVRRRYPDMAVGKKKRPKKATARKRSTKRRATRKSRRR
jgi:hypothetical protein